MKNVHRFVTFQKGYCEKWPYMALWPNGLVFMALNKFGNWPVGAHVIRFATGTVDKYKAACYRELHQWRTM